MKDTSEEVRNTSEDDKDTSEDVKDTANNAMDTTETALTLSAGKGSAIKDNQKSSLINCEIQKSSLNSCEETQEGLDSNPGEGTSGETPALGPNPLTQEIPSDGPQEGEEPTPQEGEENLQQTRHRRIIRPPDIPAVRGAVTAWISFFNVYRQ